METILYNGKIYTMDKDLPEATAVKIRDNRIVDVGTDDLLKEKNEDIKPINLNGRTLLPGFCDGHTHLLSFGYSLEMVDLNNANSIEDIVEITKKHIKEHRLNQFDWIEGRGWNENKFIHRNMPNRYDLDRISNIQPIVLIRTCGQVCVCNTKALEYLKLENHIDIVIEGGSVELDEDGIPTGILKGNAMKIMFEKIPKLGKERIKDIIIKASKECLKYGITSVQTDDFELVRAGNFNDILEAYLELDEESKLPIRINKMLYLPNKDLLNSFLKLGYKTGDGSDYFKIGPFKLQMDGSLGAKTAALNEPYIDDEQNRGILLMTQDEINELVEIAFKNDLQVVVDAIGDRAMEMVIKSYKKILEGNKVKDLRFGIDHCQITTRQIIEDFSKYNVVAGLELVFLSSDIPIIEKRVGIKRAKWTYNWKSFLNNGVIISAGSDIPVEPANPMLGIYSAVTRKQMNGLPGEGWLPEQKLTIQEAVYAYTMGTAFSCFEENIKGSVTKGKYADLIILSDDIFKISPEMIKDITIEATIIDGKIVYGDI